MKTVDNYIKVVSKCLLKKKRQPKYTESWCCSISTSMDIETKITIRTGGTDRNIMSLMTLK